MGDDKTDKGRGNAKPPATVAGLPQDLADFLDCKSDKVELKPGKQAWLGGIPTLGDVLGAANITFESNADGSVNAKAQLGEGGFSTSVTVKMKFDAAGNLTVESDSLVLKPFKKQMDDWANDLNNWLKSKGKKFGKPKVGAGSGKLTLTKEIAAAVAPEKGVKEHAGSGPWPLVPLGHKIAAGAVLLVATAAGVALIPSDTTTKKTVTEVVQVPVAAETPIPPPVPTNEPDPIIGDACFALMHVPGQYSDIHLIFTSYPQYEGLWKATFGQAPSGAESGSGQLGADGHGDIDVRIFQFGPRNDLTITAPDGSDVPIGPFTAMLPLNVTNAPLACNPTSLRVPVFKPPTGSGTGTNDKPTLVDKTITRDVTTTESGGAPWSLLLIPGTAAICAGGLALDDRRQRAARRDVISSSYSA